MKRLAASVTVAGRENGFDAERRAAIVRQVVGKYRRAIRQFATMKTLDVWYARASSRSNLVVGRGSLATDRRGPYDQAPRRGLALCPVPLRLFGEEAVRWRQHKRIGFDGTVAAPHRSCVQEIGEML